MSPSGRFTDRTEAGEQLGDALRARELDVDVVLAIPRGGLPVGRAVADTLGVPLDIVVASKIGAPGNPEYAIGAVASDGSVWRDDRAVAGTGADEAYFERERKKEAEYAREKADRYRGAESGPDLTGKTVAVVDDGVATGSTVRACLRMLETADTGRVVLAVPVGPPDTVDELQSLADEVVCPETPSDFRGVGQFYDRFPQVSDEEAMAYLETDS
jgi:putative phosphoribosyl transferase